MKKIRGWKIILDITTLLVADTSTGLLVTKETKDLRIDKKIETIYFLISKILDLFFTLFSELNTFYVDEINPDKLIKAGIDNMLKTLDPYTVYYPESDVGEFTFMTTGKYGGIGSMVRNSGDYV